MKQPINVLMVDRVIREQDLFFQMGKHLIPPRLRRNQ
jgi:hypothetical protein